MGFLTCHPALEECVKEFVEDELLHLRIGTQHVIVGKASMYFRAAA